MLISDTPKHEEIFNKITEKAFALLKLSGDAIVEVDFVSREEIHELNLKARSVDRATDVLSFPYLSELREFTAENYPYDYDEERRAVSLGSIVICEDVAREQAEEYGHSVERETCYLFTHGLLHLLGYDHIEDNDRAKMREKEEAILTSLGIVRSEK